MNPLALEAANLTVSYSGHKVLDVPTLQVTTGEKLVIVGPNGSGKTTLLQCLALLMKPTAGSISYFGQPVVDQRQALALRRRVAVVFQESLLISGTVRDNVMLGMRLRGFPGPAATVSADRWLEKFGVSHLARRLAKTLSGGEAKRVSLARAFALGPEILFLDEPFTALDGPTRQALTEDFEDILRETRVSTIMVTHERNEALALGDRVAVLINGSVRQIGRPGEVFNYPVDEEVAGFVEAGNILPGVVTEQNDGLAVVAVNGHELEAVSGLPEGRRVTATVAHEDVTLSRMLPSSTSARNRFAGTVARVFPLGSQMRVTLDCAGLPLVALITRRSWEGMGLAEGQPLTATFKASAVHLIAHK
jgi:tungstate transport system ATP-binding protein